MLPFLLLPFLLLPSFFWLLTLCISNISFELLVLNMVIPIKLDLTSFSLCISNLLNFRYIVWRPNIMCSAHSSKTQVHDRMLDLYLTYVQFGELNSSISLEFFSETHSCLTVENVSYWESFKIIPQIQCGTFIK